MTTGVADPLADGTDRGFSFAEEIVQGFRSA